MGRLRGLVHRRGFGGGDERGGQREGEQDDEGDASHAASDGRGSGINAAPLHLDGRARKAEGGCFPGTLMHPMPLVTDAWSRPRR